MEKRIKKFWIAGFFLHVINATVFSGVTLSVEIEQNFVAFSEYLGFKNFVKTCGKPITRLELGYFTLHPNPNERTDRVVRH